MSPLPPTHFHPTPLLTLAPHLTPHLPHSLPLLRRLQHHHSSPHAHILATFPPTQVPPSSYSALWIDRSRGPETECWLFSTYELPPTSPHSHNNASLARAELLALFNAVAQLPVPPNRPPGTDFIVVGSLRESLVHLLGGEDLKHLIPQSVLSTNLADLPNNASPPLSRDGNDEDKKGGMGGVLGGLSTPYMKWIITPPPPGKEQEKEERDKDLELPPGYYYDPVRADRGEYKLVLSRTSIPRSEATLAQLGSVGIRYLPPNSRERKIEREKERGEENIETGELISWAFLGVDGSLTSLHVEPSHRGRGLAKAVAKTLFRKLEKEREEVGFASVQRAETVQGDERNVQGDKDVGGNGDGAWAHSDVAVENLGSAGVARAVGGREGWVVRWCHVDLGKVRGGI